MKQSIEKIPTWAFGYIFNGDMTGLTDEEVRMIGGCKLNCVSKE